MESWALIFLRFLLGFFCFWFFFGISIGVILLMALFFGIVVLVGVIEGGGSDLLIGIFV